MDLPILSLFSNQEFGQQILLYHRLHFEIWACWHSYSTLVYKSICCKAKMVSRRTLPNNLAQAGFPRQLNWLNTNLALPCFQLQWFFPMAMHKINRGVKVIEINNTVQLSTIVVQFGWQKDNGFIWKQKAVTHRFYEKHPFMLLMWKCRSFLKVNISCNGMQYSTKRGHRSATIISFLEREGGSHDCLRSGLNSSSSFSWTHIKLKDWKLLSKLVLFTFFLHFDWSHCRILITHVNSDLTCPCPLPPQIHTIQIPISKNFAFPCFMWQFVWQSYSPQNK
jgi:hypothetical protein